MNAKRIFILCCIVFVLLFGLIAIGSTIHVTAQSPTATGTPTVAPTAMSTTAFLPDPPDPEKLPTDLSADILYQEPPEDCAVANDPQETCSTRPGQVTDADFVLSAQTALVMTGDVITLSQDKKELVKRPNKKSGHDLWVVVNNARDDIKLHMKAPHGSFRGYFTTEAGTWTVEQISYLRNLHLERFLQPPQPRAYTPTPVQNCGRPEGCPNSNVRVAVWDGKKWLIDAGFYWLKDPYWLRAS